VNKAIGLQECRDQRAVLIGQDFDAPPDTSNDRTGAPQECVAWAVGGKRMRDLGAYQVKLRLTREQGLQEQVGTYERGCRVSRQAEDASVSQSPEPGRFAGFDRDLSEYWFQAQPFEGVKHVVMIAD
tara:strand:- start:2 stop:382 length:381 start_codon:yes stop_codon:yes gene_type:complete